jgi:hypothetical protein
MEDDPSIELGQFCQKVKHEVHLLFFLDWVVADYHHDTVIHFIGHDRINQFGKKLFDYASV